MHIYKEYMNSQPSLKVKKMEIQAKTKCLKYSKEISLRNPKSPKIHRVFKENSFKPKITRKIKKKRKRPFKNLRKILNVVYRKKQPQTKMRFKGDLQEDVTVLYLIIRKFILDNKLSGPVSCSISQGKFFISLFLIPRKFQNKPSKIK